MAFPFYGNQAVQDSLHRMIANKRTAHGFLFYGEAGLGKKTLAQRLMAEMLCTGSEKPCGGCKSCRMLAENVHPDVYVAPHSGKLGGFSVDTIRHVRTALATPPNEGDARFFLFTDCDKMNPRTQNLLLKAVEEPPDYGYFIFTAESPAALLPTVRSRIIALAVSPVTEQECMTALLERGFSPEECREASAAFHGNLGKCVEYLENQTIREIIALTKSAINSIIERNEYALLQTVSQLGKDREQIRLFLTLFDRILRDGLARKKLPQIPCIGCDEKGADRFAAKRSTHSGQAMHLAVSRAYAAMQANVSPSLTMAAFCAECMNV